MIGKVAGPHGIKGVVRVCSFSESGAVFAAGRKIGIGNDQDEFTWKTLEWAKPHGKNFLVSFQGVTDVESARELGGCSLFIERTALPEPESGTYYWCDLIGLKVYTENAEFLGCIDAIIPTGSNDVYVVKDLEENGKRETLIPALASVVKTVDLKQGVMRVALPEGL